MKSIIKINVHDIYVRYANYERCMVELEMHEMFVIYINEYIYILVYALY